MQKGLSALSVLETACETSWEKEQKYLQENCESLHEVVQQSYQEMWLRSQQTYEQMKRDLADMRSQFEQLLLDRNFQLSPEVSDLCEEILPNHLFCVIVGDRELSVAETLLTDFHILAWDMKREGKRNWGLKLQRLAENKAVANRYDIAVQAAENAKQFGVEGPDFTNEAIQQREEAIQQLQRLFSITTINEAEECLKTGQIASKNGDFDAALTELQRGTSILKGSNNWELYLQLSGTIAETHYQRGKYEDTVDVCQHILSIWTPTSHSLEFLQALFYLIDSYFQLEQHSHGDAEEEKWADKLIAECSRCQCTRLCIEGLICYYKGRNKEGAQCIEMVLQLDSSNSFLTIRCMDWLGDIYQKQDRLDKSAQVSQSVCELYIAHFPHSIHYANCLNHLGGLYEAMKRPLEAEEQFMKAIQLYSIHFPLSIHYANCLSNLGLLYEAIGRPLKAEEQWMNAAQLYSTHFPQCIQYPQCLFNLGRLYHNTKRAMEAEEQYMQAIQLYSTNFPHSREYGQSLFDIGILFSSGEMNSENAARWDEALTDLQLLLRRD